MLDRYRLMRSSSERCLSSKAVAWPLSENVKKFGRCSDCDAWDGGGADDRGIGAGGTAILSVTAGGETTPVLGNGAGIGSGTFPATAAVGPRKLSAQVHAARNAAETIAGPSLAKPLAVISFSRR